MKMFSKQSPWLSSRWMVLVLTASRSLATSDATTTISIGPDGSISTLNAQGSDVPGVGAAQVESPSGQGPVAVVTELVTATVVETCSTTASDQPPSATSSANAQGISYSSSIVAAAASSAPSNPNVVPGTGSLDGAGQCNCACQCPLSSYSAGWSMSSMPLPPSSTVENTVAAVTNVAVVPPNVGEGEFGGSVGMIGGSGSGSASSSSSSTTSWSSSWIGVGGFGGSVGLASASSGKALETTTASASSSATPSNSYSTPSASVETTAAPVAGSSSSEPNGTQVNKGQTAGVGCFGGVVGVMPASEKGAWLGEMSSYGAGGTLSGSLGHGSVPEGSPSVGANDFGGEVGYVPNAPGSNQAASSSWTSASSTGVDTAAAITVDSISSTTSAGSSTASASSSTETPSPSSTASANSTSSPSETSTQTQSATAPPSPEASGSPESAPFNLRSFSLHSELTISLAMRAAPTKLP